jgi:DNA primase
MITPQELSKELNLEHTIIKDDEIHASCPFAAEYHTNGKDSRPSFSLNINKGVFYCFACGSKGSIEQLVQYINDTSIYEAIDWLEKIGYDILEVRLQEPITEHFQPVVREAILNQFVLLDDEYIEIYQGDIDGKECVVFPVRDRSGKLVGGIARSLEGRVHMVLWGMEKSHYLFGEDRVKIGEPLVIVEGPKDVRAIRASGMQAVGLMGAHISQIQLNKIVELSSDVTIWLDNDAAGKKGYKKLTTGLENVINVRYVTKHFLEEEKGDADEVYRRGGVDTVQRFISDSKSLLELLYDRSV